MKRAPRSFYEYLIRETAKAKREMKAARAKEMFFYKEGNSDGLDDATIYAVYETQSEYFAMLAVLAEFKRWRSRERIANILNHIHGEHVKRVRARATARKSVP